MKNVVSALFFFWPLLLSAYCTPAVAQDSAIINYIERYKAIAAKEMERTGVPAAISLAQGIVESRAGRGWLVERSHNHFGIKCKADWTGETILYDDDQKDECFRVYVTDDSSWRDHSDFLRKSPRYASLFQLDPLDYKAWAYGLKNAGYATSKTYADQLITYIERYQLQQYSEMALAQMPTPADNTFAVMLEKKILKEKETRGISLERQVQKAPSPDPAPSSFPQGEFTINGRRVIYLAGGASLMAVADKYHIRLAKLLRFNELDNDVLPGGRLIYLQKKGKKGANDIHVVAGHESLPEVAAEEGIRLKWLYKRNYLREGAAVKPGDALYLREYKPREDAPTVVHSGGFFHKIGQIFSGKKEDKETRAEAVTRPADDRKTGSEMPYTSLASGDPGTPRVEEAAVSTILYQVQTGDTLYAISRKYGSTIEQIREWNHLDNDHIRAGQELIVKK